MAKSTEIASLKNSPLMIFKTFRKIVEILEALMDVIDADAAVVDSIDKELEELKLLYVKQSEELNKLREESSIPVEDDLPPINPVPANISKRPSDIMDSYRQKYFEEQATEAEKE
jgi:hypothetical protein